MNLKHSPVSFHQQRQPTVISKMAAFPTRKESSSSYLTASPLISLSRSFVLCLLSQLLFLSVPSRSSSSSFFGAGVDADDVASLISRGVPLMKRSLYDPNLQTFACLDGSRVIPVRQVNDDYCDCKDGSDEPGTSACTQGTFYCPNLQYKPLIIPSSRVNDGICDCCDGSDEWRGVVLCSNICAELGKVLRAEAAKELEMKRAGWTKRIEYSTRGRKENEDKKLRLEELKSKKESLQKERDAAAQAKEEIEAREKDAKDKHEAVWERMKADRREELRRMAAENAFKELDTSEDGLLSSVELLGRHDLDVNGDGELSQDEAVELIGETGVDLTTFVADVWPKIETKYRAPAAIHIEEPATPETTPEAAAGEEEPLRVDEEPEAPAVEVGEDAPRPTVEALGGNEDEAADVDHHHHEDDIPDDHLAEGIEDAFGAHVDDDDEDDDVDHKDEDFHDDDVEEDDHDMDHHDATAPPIDEPPTEFASKDVDEALGLVKPEYDEDAKAKMAAANEARAAFQTVDDGFRDLERQIKDLEKAVGLDLGRSFEFAPLHGECLEYTDREYTYKLCMYDRASQRPKDGGGETSLGTFTGWENDYLLMKYEHGQGCWNGPSRSAKVVLSCGIEDKLTFVSEPSRCEYDFRVTTPAVCDKPDDGEDPGVDGEENGAAKAIRTPPDEL